MTGSTSAKPVTHIFPGYGPSVCMQRCKAHPDCICSDIQRRRMMDQLWSRHEAIHDRISALAADLATANEMLEGIVRRLRELEINGHGERG